MQLYKILLFVASILKFVNSDGVPDTEEAISSFSHEIDHWVKTGEISQPFWSSLNLLALPTSLQHQNWRSFTGERSKSMCIICQSVLKVLMGYRREGLPEEQIRSTGIKLCSLLNIESERVCAGAITLNLPIILYIIDQKSNLTASTICGVVFESMSCPLTDDEYNWTINIDNNRGTSTEKENNETINIVQITDLHYDPKYEPYGNSECGEPACCRKGQNDTNASGKLAGFWGDYNYCDTPWHAVIDALYHIKETHKDISYVYFTGDLVDHGVWETTLEGNIQIINESFHFFHEVFEDIPVYPVLGNHESQPLNQYAPITVTDDKVSTLWLYNMIADLWIGLGWLPESTRSTILQGGYYTVSPKKGFRIIGLNNNLCYCYNWWIWYQPRDAANQLQWLADTLLQAEKDNEVVHILAHVPPTDQDCQATWKREFHKIMNRFGHIIKAQFNGHTHNDELELIYSSDENKKIINVAWNGGSVTTFTELNPNYKIYNVDSENYVVKDYENWIYNVTLANDNVNERPQWYKSYSFKEEYGLLDLSYNSLNDWYIRLSHDDDLLKHYYGHFFKLAEPSLRKECDTKCMRTKMCRIIASLGNGTSCD
ncbi:sphingomyelin phosphodiesterase 1-like [Odontomachus brunneus]|uniref:sphingomyelin phosphodiesterase 1-like n=1 Tax=Odontomachus brunneus TaxID=486640 RepID=UPI0013F2890B|nr:sphingomyelin phosphodiesterase 1-like [Odontomachus brunneus]